MVHTCKKNFDQSVERNESDFLNSVSLKVVFLLFNKSTIQKLRKH